MVRLPPSSTRTDTRFPHTMPFRSVQLAPAGTGMAAPGRYGEDRKPNLPAAALTLLLSAALLAALVQTRYQRPQVEAAKLAVVNLSVAPPPPAPPEKVPTPQHAPIVAPTPLIAVPNTRPALLVSPDPLPPPPVPIAVPPAPDRTNT